MMPRRSPFSPWLALMMSLPLLLGGALASRADEINVELRPLAGQLPTAISVWELCFTANVDLNRLTVGAIYPTTYPVTETMEWVDCPVDTLAPIDIFSCDGADTIFDQSYLNVFESDSFSEWIDDTLFLVLGGQGTPSGEGLSIANLGVEYECVARLSLSSSVVAENPPGLVVLASSADPSAMALHWSDAIVSSCREPIVVDDSSSRMNCENLGSGSGLTDLDLSSSVVSTVPEDYDGDLHADEEDNCVYTYNLAQADHGGLKTTSADGVGDLCQCGEGEGSGEEPGQGTIEVGDDDLSNMLAHLRGETPAGFDESRCSLGNPSTCTIQDAALLDNALQSSATLDNVCNAYTP